MKPRPLTDPVIATLTLSTTASPDGWIEVYARGEKGFVHGHTPIYDVMLEINRGQAFDRERD